MNTFHFLPWMTETLLRSLALLVLAGVALVLLRLSSAALRHLALSCTAGGLLVLPLLSLLLPAWSVPQVPNTLSVLRQQASGNGAAVSVEAPQQQGGSGPPLPSEQGEPRVSPTESGAAAGRSSASGVTPSRPSGNLPKATVISARMIAPVLLLMLWSLGAALLLLRLGVSLLRLHRLAKTAQDATVADPRLTEPVHSFIQSRRLRRSVRLLLGPSTETGLSPMTWGLLRPVVLLPVEVTAWPLARLRSVLLHELAHVQRGDWGTDVLAQVVCALYWPNPLVWLLARRLRSESERACDDRVLLAGVAPAEYALHLVDVVRDLRARNAETGKIHSPAAAVMMARKSGVESRVRAILTEGCSRRPATLQIVAVALAAAASILLPVASLRSASAEDRKRTDMNDVLRIGDTTFYNSAIPWAQRLAKMKPKITPEEYRALDTIRISPGSDRFPNGVVAEGLYVEGVQRKGSVAAWDRKGNLLMYSSPTRESRLQSGEVRFQIERLKLPGVPEWIDKATRERLESSREIETEFGVVGEPSRHFGVPGGTNDGNGYFSFGASHTWKPRTATKVDLYLTTSYGPWQELGTSTLRQEGRALASGGAVTLSRLVTRRRGSEAEVTAALPARFLAKDANGRPLWSLRMEPVDAAGNAVGRPRIAQYEESRAGSPAARVRLRFLTSEVSFAKVNGVRLLARPVQTLYFRNIPTSPKWIPAVSAASQ